MNVCVFCASQPADDRQEELYGLAARFGGMLARNGFVCVNGGSCGMMHHVSRGAIMEGGEVHCVGHTLWGLDHEYYTTCELLPTLIDRQRRLVDLGIGFVALPGGIGTDFEILHVLTHKFSMEIPMDAPLICVGRDDFADLHRRIAGHLPQGRASGYKNAIEYLSFVDTPEEAIAFLNAYRDSR